jgi:hypothetical protein
MVVVSRDFESRAGRLAKCDWKSAAGQGRLLAWHIKQWAGKIK